MSCGLATISVVICSRPQQVVPQNRLFLWTCSPFPTLQSAGFITTDRMSRHYVDNAQNRSLGRVGMAHGTAVHSRSSPASASISSHANSSMDSYSSPRVYADNGMNQRLGRVGRELGSAPHSSSSAITSPRTYADNTQNRSLGRVGMEHGTAVHSRSSVLPDKSLSSGGYGSLTSDASPRVYVDNSLNRRLGRAGLEMGSAPHSSASSASTIVEKTQNKSLGRVRHEHGTAAHNYPTPTGRAGYAAVEVAPKRTYADNAYNRRLGRVGLVLGTAVHSCASGSNAAVSASAGRQVRPLSSVRTYVENALNRRLGRVGLPLGSMPVSSSKSGNVRVEKLKGLIRELAPGSPVSPYGGRSSDSFSPYAGDWGNGYAAGARDAYEQIWQRKQEAEDAGDGDAADACDQMEGIVNRYEASKSSKFIRERVPEWLKSGDVIEYADLEVGDRLGSGGFGDVHVAIWDGVMQVCVKKLRVQRVSERRKKLFQQEVQSLSSLKHPAIVTFFGACVTTPNLAIVMEFMRRGSLFDVVHIEEHQFTDDAKFSLIIDLLNAVRFIHGRDFAHRDIKSMNVLICEDMMHCKLGDFGLALKDEAASNSSVADHSVVGTIKYSPIEVLEGSRLTVDQFKAVDVYSLGVTIVELMTERKPFDGMNLHQIRAAVRDGEKRDLQSVDHLPLKRLLSLCLSRRSSNRPTANLFLRQFIDFVNDYRM